MSRCWFNFCVLFLIHGIETMIIDFRREEKTTGIVETVDKVGKSTMATSRKNLQTNKRGQGIFTELNFDSNSDIQFNMCRLA